MSVRGNQFCSCTGTRPWFSLGPQPRKQRQGIAFMEAMTGPLTWPRMPSTFRAGFLFMRSPGIGWLMISVADMFVKKFYPNWYIAD